MRIKRLLLGVCICLCITSVHAQENENEMQKVKAKPTFRLGGALRFNYNFCDWKPGHRDRGGDFGYDVLYFKLSASYRDIILSADYRFYSKDFGGPMLKYGWIGYRFNEKNQIQLGLTGVPFGIQPVASHNFFLQIAYYVGLEDDSDMGLKYLYSGDRWDFTLAFFKNADELLFGSDNETSDDRYGYDVAGRNKEINQFNGQVFYKFGRAAQQRLGASGEFGQLYNLDTRDNGTHYALALHYELLWKKFSLKAQATTYAMYPKNQDGDDDDLISMTAYGAPYLVAAKANIYMLGAGYTFPVNRKYLKKIQIYNDFGWLDKWDSDFKDSFQNVSGLMLDGGPVCIYIDYALAKNHGWLGPDFNGFGAGGESNSWHARFNVNVGYYF